MYSTLSSKISNKYIFTAKENKRKKQAKLGNKKGKGGEVSERQNYIHKIFLSLA